MIYSGKRESDVSPEERFSQNRAAEPISVIFQYLDNEQTNFS
jgi:hypothetical protein